MIIGSGKGNMYDRYLNRHNSGEEPITLLQEVSSVSTFTPIVQVIRDRHGFPPSRYVTHLDV